MKFPSDEAEIIYLTTQGYRAIGNAWSFYLSHTKVSGNIMVLSSNWSGVCSCSDNIVCAKSGTSMGELQRALGKRYTIDDRSQYDDLTIGGSVVTQAHGWNAHTKFIDCIESVVIATPTGKIVRCERYDECSGTLLYINLKRVPSKMVTVTRRRNTLDGWEDALHRMILINRHGYLVTTTQLSSSNYSCSKPPLRISNLNFLVCGGSEREFVCQTSEIHQVMDRLSPIEILAMKFYRNCEIFSTATLQREQLVNLISTLTRFHVKYGGHTEIRKQKDVWAIDMALFNTALFGKMSLLLAQFGIQTNMVHSGKYNAFAAQSLADVEM